MPATSINKTVSIEVSQLAAAAAADKLGEDIKILDIQALIGICDCFVIITGSNPRQVKAISGEIEVKLKMEMNATLLYIEGSKEDWLLMDYGDIVIHIFTAEARQYYNLDRLWSDCPIIKP